MTEKRFVNGLVGSAGLFGMAIMVIVGWIFLVSFMRMLNLISEQAASSNLFDFLYLAAFCLVIEFFMRGSDDKSEEKEQEKNSENA